MNALKSLKEKGLVNKLEVNFVGTMHPDALQFINSLGLNDIVNIINYLPHGEVIKHIVNSEILLLLIPDTENNEGILTGKLFEYIGGRNFILGFGPVNGDAATIINGLNRGTMLEYSTEPEEIILSKYNVWLKGGSLLEKTSGAEQYTRRNLTKKLVEVFESLL